MLCAAVVVVVFFFFVVVVVVVVASTLGVSKHYIVTRLSKVVDVVPRKRGLSSSGRPLRRRRRCRRPRLGLCKQNTAQRAREVNLFAEEEGVAAPVKVGVMSLR